MQSRVCARLSPPLSPLSVRLVLLRYRLYHKSSRYSPGRLARSASGRAIARGKLVNYHHQQRQLGRDPWRSCAGRPPPLAPSTGSTSLTISWLESRSRWSPRCRQLSGTGSTLALPYSTPMMRTTTTVRSRRAPHLDLLSVLSSGHASRHPPGMCLGHGRTWCGCATSGGVSIKATGQREACTSFRCEGCASEGLEGYRDWLICWCVVSLGVCCGLPRQILDK